MAYDDRHIVLPLLRRARDSMERTIWIHENRRPEDVLPWFDDEEFLRGARTELALLNAAICRRLPAFETKPS